MTLAVLISTIVSGVASFTLNSILVKDWRRHACESLCLASVSMLLTFLLTVFLITRMVTL